MPLSLISVVIGITLLALFTTAVQPSLLASDNARLDAAASELANLLRIARNEAIRLQAPHGVIFDDQQQRFLAVSADTSTEPFTELAAIYHPIRKQPLVWETDSWVDLTPSNQVFDLGASGTTNQILFDGWGTPVSPQSGIHRQLNTSVLTLSSGNVSKRITLQAINGRVSVQ